MTNHFDMPSAEQRCVPWSGMAASPETRIVDCDHCGGDGGWETQPRGFCSVRGTPITDWIECTACDGTGEMEIEVEPISQEELPC